MKEPKDSENRLLPENCNKAQCKTCIFGPKPVRLSPQRIEEIHNYLASGTATHICHTTNKTCYGALAFQAKIFHATGLIAHPTVESLLSTAAQYLNLNKAPDDTARKIIKRKSRKGR